jgi:hypothetical protein
VSHIKAVGVAIITVILLAIGSLAVGLAATKEEVSRCRAIQQPVQRRDCFEFLKKGPKAKAEEAAKAKTENAPSPRRRMSQPPPLLIVLTSLLVSPFAWIAMHSLRCWLLAYLLPVHRRQPRTVAKPFLRTPR